MQKDLATAEGASNADSEAQMAKVQELPLNVPLILGAKEPGVPVPLTIACAPACTLPSMTPIIHDNPASPPDSSTVPNQT